MSKSKKVTSSPQGSNAAADDLLYIVEGLHRLRNTFNSGKTRDYEWRIKQLKQIKKMLKENEITFAQALANDLGRFNILKIYICTLVTSTKCKKLC